MTILRAVLKELFGMFLADARLAAAILGTVAAAAGLTRLSPLLGGGVLLAGCIAVLVVSVRMEARRRRSGK